jgi:hypothetical protein
MAGPEGLWSALQSSAIPWAEEPTRLEPLPAENSK